MVRNKMTPSRGFSDEDVKRLKEGSSIDGLFLNATIPEKLKALLHRLECAEAFIRCLETPGECNKYHREAWLRSKGTK